MLDQVAPESCTIPSAASTFHAYSSGLPHGLLFIKATTDVSAV